MKSTTKKVLTDNQRKLIEDNLDYAFYYFNMHNITSEDKRQELLYALCRNIHLYDPSRGTITTFMTTVFESKNYNMYRCEKRLKRILNSLCISLNDVVLPGVDGSENLTVEDIIGNPEIGFDEFETTDLYNYIIKKLSKTKYITPKHVQIFIAYLNTLNQSEVARMYGVSRQTVNTTIQKVRNIIKLKGWASR